MFSGCPLLTILGFEVRMNLIWLVLYLLIVMLGGVPATARARRRVADVMRPCEPDEVVDPHTSDAQLLQAPGGGDAGRHGRPVVHRGIRTR
jgi:hypothetical protein